MCGQSDGKGMAVTKLLTDANETSGIRHNVANPFLGSEVLGNLEFSCQCYHPRRMTDLARTFREGFDRSA